MWDHWRKMWNPVLWEVGIQCHIFRSRWKKLVNDWLLRNYNPIIKSALLVNEIIGNLIVSKYKKKFNCDKTLIKWYLGQNAFLPDQTLSPNWCLQPKSLRKQFCSWKWQMLIALEPAVNKCMLFTGQSDSNFLP